MGKSSEPLIEAALAAARAADWAAFRARFAVLRDACAELLEQDEDLRQRFDTLGAAAPQYDPEGCVAAFEALAAALRGRPAQAPGASRPGAPPALDLRGLQPPEPIVRIFQALERAPGAPLRAILPHEPVPLYGLLAERGFACSGTQRADGGYELLIERVSLR
ncbi:MAG: DUF2249 domain-containing protein [Burkholderiales bacterium]